MATGFRDGPSGAGAQPELGTSAEDRLVVYGTLAPGRSNSWVLEPLEGRWFPATVLATYDETGWGMTEGFPGLRPHPSNLHSVQLFVSERLSDRWAWLDEFEDRYQRTLIEATLVHSGERVSAYTYLVPEQ